MKKPIRAKWSAEEHVSLLKFDDERGYIKHDVRGAITWPEGGVAGYALLGAKDLEAGGVCTIYEEFPFWSIKTIGMSKPLWQFFELAWKKYLCRSFYQIESQSHPRFIRQVHEEPLIRSRPVIFSIDMEMENRPKTREGRPADGFLLEYQAQKKLKIDKDAGDDSVCQNLFNQMLQYVRGFSLDDADLPAIGAIRCLLAAFERYPYQRPGPPDKIPDSYF